LIREAMEWIAGQREKALELKTVLDLPEKKVFLSRDGQRIDVDLPPPDRRHLVNTLADLIAAADRWGSSGVVWHSRDRVILSCDDTIRRDTVVLKLDRTEQWTLIELLSSPEHRGLDQRAFCRLLRYDLRECLPASLLPAISKIEVLSSQQSRSEINPGRERGTREFAADLAASGEIPEIVSCTVPVYAVPDFSPVVTIHLGLEYTLPPQPVTFTLRALAGELDRAYWEVQGLLRNTLDAELEIPVFYGRRAAKETLD
jgi:hypothetical protein